MKVYYLNRERFSKGDTKIAFEFAKKLILENPNLKILTFLVYQQRQYEAWRLPQPEDNEPDEALDDFLAQLEG